MTATILLTGCATKVFESDLEIYCTPTVEYTDAFNQQLANEIESLPSHKTAIVEALADYITMRDLSERCEKVRSNF